MAEVKLPNPIITPGKTSASDLSLKSSLVFRVHSDNRRVDDDVSVLEFTSIPRLGSPYSFGGKTRYNLRARDYSPTYVGNWGPRGGIWDVEVSYTNETNAENPPDPSVDDPYTVASRMETIQIPMEIDLDGVLVRNSAGQKFDVPPNLDLHYPVFTITRTEYANPCRRMMDFINRVNHLEFWGFAPGRVCLLNMAPSTSVAWGAPSWQVQYEIGINPYGNIDLWQTEILDAGLMERTNTQDGTNAINLRMILDSQGKEITEPWPLDGSGKKLPDNGNPVWLWYRKRPAADLNQLRIPNPFLV